MGVFTAIIVYLSVKGILFVVGFGSGGVIAGSIAAWWHAAIGNVATGSLFAGLQSLGAVGLSVGVPAAFGAAVAAFWAWLT